jgi:hypothetical protein
MNRRRVQLTALLGACVLCYTGCTTVKPVPCPPCAPVEVKVPVPVQCPAPPAIQAPDLWVPKLDLTTASVNDILAAIAHDYLALEEYANKLAQALEAYRVQPPS